MLSRLTKLARQLSHLKRTRPTMSSKGLVFITGATGFIGSQVADATLKAGYRVRLSVRKPEQIQGLKDIFASHADRLEFVVVPDIAKADAFADALGDVDYIFHLASPMPGKGSDVRKDYVEPAVKGTESILLAAKASPSVKRVIVVSSIVALARMGSLHDPSLDVKENSGEEIPVDLDMPFPEGLVGRLLRYQASKILAHRASRDWMAARAPRFSLVTLHPSYVLGPSLIQKTAQDIGGPNALFWGSLFADAPLLAPPVFVDVRDVADAHIRAIDAPLRPGETEFLLNSPRFAWDDVVAFVKARYPDLGVTLQPPAETAPTVDTPGADEVLGLQWRRMEDTVGALVDQQLALRG